jgi:hypothetical protein
MPKIAPGGRIGHAMTNAECKAAQRARAIKAGLCQVCCHRKRSRGKTVCAPCNEAAKLRVKAARALGDPSV